MLDEDACGAKDLGYPCVVARPVEADTVFKTEVANLTLDQGPQRPVSDNDQAGAGYPRRRVRERFERQHGGFLRDEPSHHDHEPWCGLAGAELLEVDAVRQNLDLILLGSQRDQLLLHALRDGDHGPALSEESPVRTSVHVEQLSPECVEAVKVRDERDAHRTRGVEELDCRETVFREDDLDALATEVPPVEHLPSPSRQSPAEDVFRPVRAAADHAGEEV